MRKALIAWGGWDGHEPEAGRGAGRRDPGRGGLRGDDRAGSAAFADPGLAGFSLIVPILTMSTIGKEELANLLAAVKGGVGLGGYHGGMADAFRNEPEYQFMVGGQWVAHPGNVIDYRVDVTRPDDPVMAGIARASPTARSSTTCTSTRGWRCWRPRPSPASMRSGSRARWCRRSGRPATAGAGSSSARSGTWRPSSTCRRWRRSCAAGWSGRRLEGRPALQGLTAIC